MLRRRDFVWRLKFIEEKLASIFQRPLEPVAVVTVLPIQVWVAPVSRARALLRTRALAEWAPGRKLG